VAGVSASVSVRSITGMTFPPAKSPARVAWSAFGIYASMRSIPLREFG